MHFINKKFCCLCFFVLFTSMVYLKMSTKVINLVYSNSTGNIWNIEDWRTARQQRIIGSFHGCLPNIPHQGSTLGFPLSLTKNETTLLLEKGLARLRVAPELVEEPDDSVREKCCTHRHHSISEQRILLKEEKRSNILKNADIIVRGKMKKRRRMSDVSDIDVEKEKIIEEEIAKIQDSLEQNLYVETCLEDPWISTWSEIEWKYPQTPVEQVEYAAFRSLWESGYCITPGGKFGGNLLVYSGDCLLTHAIFIVTCVSRDEAITTEKIVALSRLAHTVRKVAVLAYLDGDDVKFQSISWNNER